MQDIASQRACPGGDAVEVEAAQPVEDAGRVGEVGLPPFGEIFADNGRLEDPSRHRDAVLPQFGDPAPEGVAALRDVLHQQDDGHEKNNPDKQREGERRQQSGGAAGERGSEPDIGRPDRNGDDRGPRQGGKKVPRDPKHEQREKYGEGGSDDGAAVRVDRQGLGVTPIRLGRKATFSARTGHLASTREAGLSSRTAQLTKGDTGGGQRGVRPPDRLRLTGASLRTCQAASAC